MKTPPLQKRARSLLEFATEKRRAERREKCAVCRLPDEIRAQLRQAREKGIERRVVIEWLRAEHERPITDLELTQHYAGHHEEKDVTP